jgi:hypothetical protein
MIRFLDLTKDYFALSEQAYQIGKAEYPSICAFIDTVTDTFLIGADAAMTFSDMQSVREMPGIGERCARLVPKDFFRECVV